MYHHNDLPANLPSSSSFFLGAFSRISGSAMLLLAVVIFTALPGALAMSESRYNDNGGNKMVFMTNGDIDDFGWSNIMNAGRVNMERLLNMSGSIWLPNVKDNVSALAAIEYHVARGATVIISGTGDHGNAPTVGATKYPNVTFVKFGGRSTLPNLSGFSWSTTEFYYAIGVVAGLITENNHVGFVIAGGASIANAFYSGAKYANANAIVHIIDTDEYLEVDRAIGASQILIDAGCDALGAQQDDMTVQQTALANGLLAIGANGFSLRTLYGEQVALSFVRDWTSALVYYASGRFGTVVKRDITASFANGGQMPDLPSHFLEPSEFAVLTDAIAQIVAGKQLWNCGPYMSTVGPLNPTTGCLNSTTSFSRNMSSEIINFGLYTVPLTRKEFPVGATNGIIAATSVLIVLPVIIAIAVVILRARATILAGSPYFLIITLLGCIITYVGTITWVLDPSEAICQSRIWLPSVGFTLAMGSLVLKNVRIYLVFWNPELKNRADLVSLRNFSAIMVGLLALNFVILGVYHNTNGNGPHIIQGVHNLGKYETQNVCEIQDESTTVIYVLLAFHAALLAFGLWLSFVLRAVNLEAYQERRSLGFAILWASLVLAVGVLVVAVTQPSYETTVLMICLFLLLGNGVLQLVIFGSRFVDLFFKEVNPVGSLMGALRKYSPKSDSNGRSRSSGVNADGTSSTAASTPDNTDDDRDHVRPSYPAIRPPILVQTV